VKPNPGLFLHAASARGVAPERYAVVEDSIPGERAGLAAGTAVVTLLPAKPADDVSQEVCVVAHLRELHEIFWNAEIAF